MVSPERDIQGAASLDDEVLGCPVTPVREALEATYETDAHLYPAVLYVDGEPEAQQPRLKKAGLGAFSAVGDVSITSVFIDVDNEGHNPWASTKEATSTLETLIDAHGDGVLAHAAVYATRAGWRAVFAVAPPIPAARYRATLGHPGDKKIQPSGLLGWFGAALAADLQKQDIAPSCNQWTRCFRAPRVMRDGVPTDNFTDFDGLDAGPLDVSEWLDIAGPEKRTVAPAEVDLARPSTEPLSVRQWAMRDLDNALKRRWPSSGSGPGKLPALATAIRKHMSWYGPGQRNSQTFDAVALLVELLFAAHKGPSDAQDAAETVFRALAPGTEAACRTGVSGTEEDVALDELWSMVERRVGVEVAKAEEKAAEAAEAAEAADAVMAAVNEDSDGTPSDPLAPIVVHGAGYYILNATNPEAPNYYPYSKNSNLIPYLLLKGCGDECSNGSGGGPLELWLKYESGKFRPMADLVIDYGRQVTEVIVAHGTTRPRLNEAGFSLQLPGVSAIDVEARYDPEIHAWLKYLAGDDVDGLLDWLATVTQLDWPSCAVYLQGDTGVGKGLFAACVSSIFGDTFCSFKEAVSRFNDGLMKSPIVFLDEGVPDIPELKDVTAAFRSLVGETTHRLEPKGQGLLTLRGATRVIIAANNGLALPVFGQHTAEDIAAVTSRIRWFGCDPKAADFLEKLGGKTVTNTWVGKTGAPGYFAQHAQWIQENRNVTPGTRYLVEGIPRHYHEMLAMSADRLVVLYAIGACILRGGKMIKFAGMSVEEGKDDNGEQEFRVGVNIDLLRKNWRDLTNDARSPTQKTISAALRALLGVQQKRKVGRRVYMVPARYLKMAADQMGLNGGEIERRVEVLAGGGKVGALKNA